MTPIIRLARPADLPAIHDIALLTGDGGRDASTLLADPQVIGNIFAAPHLIYAPELCIVVEDEDGPLGYAVGVLDTVQFEDWQKDNWWPTLRARYRDPGQKLQADWTIDQFWAHWIHHPPRVDARLVAGWPAHLHLNLLPRGQGRGMGRALFTDWAARAHRLGAREVHVGVDPRNLDGLAFWRAVGFQTPPGELEQIPGAWLVRSLRA